MNKKKMLVKGSGGVTPLPNWNIISGGSSDGVSILAGTTVPWNICFSEDGTKLYITGNTGDLTAQFSGTAWDLSTFTSDSKSFAFTPQTSQPFNVRWKTDGTKCYAVGRNNHTLWQYSASTSWDISTLSYDSKSLVLNNTSNTFTDAIFSPDGLNLVTWTQATGKWEYYSLSTAWDVSTGVYDALKSSVNLGTTGGEGIFMNPNGLQAYWMNSSSDRIIEYSLSVAWDFSTMALITFFSVVGQESQPRGVAFKSDGSKFYVVGSVSDKVHQYSL